MSDLIIKRPDIHGTIRQVEFTEHDQQHDPIPCLRLYCTMHNQAYNLQIRATAPLGNRHSKKELKQRNIVATISLDWADLVNISEYVDGIKKQMTAENYDDKNTIRKEVQNETK